MNRRYRESQSRPIPVWNGVLEHRERIDGTIWVFLWLLDGITEEREGVGIVLGGIPIKASRIAKDLAFTERTVRDQLETLETGHYIKRRRTPYGYAIEVSNSRKFGIWQAHKRSEENFRSGGERSEENFREIGNNPPSRSEEKRKYKEDAAKNAAITQQQATAASAPKGKDSVWTYLGIQSCGAPEFRSLLETGWASKNGTPPLKVIETALNGWLAVEGETGKRGLPPLFKALAELRARERQQSTPAAQPIHTLSPEEIPA